MTALSEQSAPVGPRVRARLLSPQDSFWLKAETARTPARWAVGLRVADLPAGPPISVEGLRAHVEGRWPWIPWLSWQIHGFGRRVGRHRWLHTSPPEIHRLVVERHGRRGELLEDHVAALLTEPLPAGLPPWRLRLLDLDERQHLILDGHHAFAGGFVVVEILHALFGAPREVLSSSMDAPPESVTPAQRLSDIGVAAVDALRSTTGRAVRRVSWQPANAGEPLVGPVSDGRSVVAVTLPSSTLEAIGAAHGASVTRVALALIARALDPVAGPDVGQLRALFPRGTQSGPVVGPGNASRSSFLALPLHAPFPDRLAALKVALADDWPAGATRPAVADVTVSFQPHTPPLAIGQRPIEALITGAPLRVCSRPLTRLTIIVQAYRGALHVSLIGDRDGMGPHLPDVARELLLSVEEVDRAASTG